MRRDPSLTYHGALQILGHHDRPLIEKLDRILGGVILVGGVAAASVLAGSAVGPLAAFSAVWGWVDQKNEANTLLRKALDGATDRILHCGGYERHRLVSAAHTTIVVAAFFEALQGYIGESAYKRLEITEAEKLRFTSGKNQLLAETAFEALYAASVPAPSPVRGFEENISEVRRALGTLALRVEAFLDKLEAWPRIRTELNGDVVDLAVERYRSHYLRIATAVPEFFIWASLGEHAATRSKLSDVREDFLAALTGQAGALARIDDVLRLMAHHGHSQRDLQKIVDRANQGVLSEPILAADYERYGNVLRIPAIGTIYVNPNYRIAATGDGARIADERWWDSQTVRKDIDMCLIAQLTSPNACNGPLLLLGHPGAGKSLLTKVLATRLPASVYTVVRVALRHVNASAPVHDQIQEALDQSTHKRVNWWELADQSRETTRVVILDGLDELLQASGENRTGYLHEVAEFQHRESMQQRPVVIIVTSRTVVADRVSIAPGTTVIKLEDFDDTQIETWLANWAAANSEAIMAGKLGELKPDVALQLEHLTRQPLLLLMLAIYCADPSTGVLTAELSSAALYKGLMVNFARREVDKVRPGLMAGDTETAVSRQLWRLAVAAFAMFNRGRQDVTDVLLGEDLSALDGVSPDSSMPAADRGQDTIGRFFFVYAPEATTLPNAPARRCYEFLHATFGEYLVASCSVDLLSDMAQVAFGGNRTRDPDDQLFFALLSNQPLAVRRTILTFAVELVSEFSQTEQSRILQVLDYLIAQFRRRHGSDRYLRYQPLPVDRIRELATYSANLVLLRVALSDHNGGASIAELWNGTKVASEEWRSTVHLWRAGLDPDAWSSVVSALRIVDGHIRILEDQDRLPTELLEVQAARLVEDQQLEDALRFGIAVRSNLVYGLEGDHWSDVVLSSLFPILTRRYKEGTVLLPSIPRNVDRSEFTYVSAVLSTVLMCYSGSMSLDSVTKCINWVLNFGSSNAIEPFALAVAVRSHPELLTRVRELSNPRFYGKSLGVAFVLGASADHSEKDTAGYLSRLSSELVESNRPGESSYLNKESYSRREVFEIVRSVLDGYSTFPVYQATVRVQNDETGVSLHRGDPDAGL